MQILSIRSLLNLFSKFKIRKAFENSDETIPEFE